MIAQSGQCITHSGKAEALRWIRLAKAFWLMPWK
ncbi:Hypothetical protein BCETI_7000366 [Brucella ceti str. Cudo]|uniref:Uncharacterized protein n=1 Tax=Brucella ceti str. Cudo TaxID=595497 RepID=C0GAP5_9HYPH|nr:Hypothetical protein BCETI_7000366 [Brucella ceti str. Cudo]